MNYPNSPIREAVFDIRVGEIKIQQDEDLFKIHDFIKNDFPIYQVRRNITGIFRITSEEAEIKNESKTDFAGYIFFSEDKKRQIQVGLDGITLNILNPYESWDVHFPYFMKLWDYYLENYSPLKVLRIATRFINRIEIPTSVSDYRDYILNMPETPQCLPKTFENYFMQMQLACDSHRTVIITEMVEPTENSKIPFILDIDVFQNRSLSTNSEEIKTNFDEIRKIKNNVYQNSITDKTKKSYL